jgi:hypothetical protein
MYAGGASGSWYFGDVSVVRLQPGLGMVVSNQGYAVSLSSQLTVVGGQIAIASDAIQATNMAANAITAANGALAASSVVDSKMVSVGINKVTYGTSIFAGDVVLSRGVSLPVIDLSNTALTLFGQADASTGATGLTSKPYVQIENTGLLVYGGNTGGGGTGPSVLVNGSSATFYSVNGSTTDPYVTVASGGLLLVAGSYTTSVSATGISIYYTGGSSLSINSTQLQITNSTSSVTVTSSSVAIVQGTLSLNLNGITTTIANVLPGFGVSTYVGLKVENNSTTDYGWVESGSLGVYKYSTSGNAQLYFDSNNMPTLNMGRGVSFATINLGFTAGGTQVLYFGTHQVLTIQQTGPGTASGWADATAQGWANNLLTALRTHGLIT